MFQCTSGGRAIQSLPASTVFVFVSLSVSFTDAGVSFAPVSAHPTVGVSYRDVVFRRSHEQAQIYPWPWCGQPAPSWRSRHRVHVSCGRGEASGAVDAFRRAAFSFPALADAKRIGTVSVR